MKVRLGPAYHSVETTYGSSMRAKDREGVRILGRWQSYVHRFGYWLADKAYDWSPLVSDEEAVRRGWATEWEKP